MIEKVESKTSKRQNERRKLEKKKSNKKKESMKAKLKTRCTAPIKIVKHGRK
jgi:hypothetical protein